MARVRWNQQTESITTGESILSDSPASVSASRVTTLAKASADSAGLFLYSQAEITRQLELMPKMLARAIMTGRRSAVTWAIESGNRVMIQSEVR